LARLLCGRREWGLRPDTQATGLWVGVPRQDMPVQLVCRQSQVFDTYEKFQKFIAEFPSNTPFYPAVLRTASKLGGLPMLKRYLTITITLVAFSLPATAVEYSCDVTRKLDREREYAAELLEKFRYSNRLEETNEGSYVSRCSFASSEQKINCDRYKIDRVAFDENVKIKKFYLFRSQLDFQLFPDLSFIENNGRGSVSYGKCKLISP